MHGRPYKLLLLALSALLLAGSGYMQRALNRERASLGLTRQQQCAESQQQEFVGASVHFSSGPGPWPVRAG